MELHQLQYFIAVVETGGFSRAAERCNITQPSLSQQIIKLENELGHSLFDRLGRTIALTDVGRELYPRALAIISEMQQIKYALTEAYDEDEGHLAIGIIPTLTPSLLRETIECFKDSYPQAKLSISEDTTEILVNQLLQGELDTAFVSLPINNANIATEKLFSEPLLVAIPANSPLTKEELIDAHVLENVPFIRLSDQNCLADQVDSFCFTQQIDPDIIYTTYHITTALEMIRAGMGVSLVPACVASTATEGVVFKYTKPQSVERVIVAAHHRGRQQSVLSKAFGVQLQQTWHQATQAFLHQLQKY